MTIGKEAPTPPPAPNPTTVANAQTGSNEQTANFQSVLNNYNQNTPYGTVNWSQGPNNQWTENTSLSPAEQSIFNQGTQAQSSALGIANQQLGNVASALGQTPTQAPLTFGVNGGQIQNSFNPGQAVQGQVNTPPTQQAVNQAEQASYNAATNLLNPQWNQATEQNQANLVAQGLNPNDAAYQNQMGIFNSNKNEAYDQAANQAVQTGQAEQNTLYNQALQSGQFANLAAGQEYNQNQGSAAFANTAQQQGFNQGTTNAQLNNAASQQQFSNQAYAQQLPINEFDALMGSNQVQAPQAQFSSTSVAPTDVTGAYALQQQALQQDYQSQVQNYQSGLGGLFNLGSAAMMAFA